MRRIVKSTGVAVALLIAGALGTTACGERERDRASETARDGARAVGDGTRAAGEAVTGTAGKVGEVLDNAGRAGDAAFETADVKTALIADDRIDASAINVDTDHQTKVVVLKGTVPSDGQRTIAGDIATRKAVGYRVRNELTVRARQ